VFQLFRGCHQHSKTPLIHFYFGGVIEMLLTGPSKLILIFLFTVVSFSRVSAQQLPNLASKAKSAATKSVPPASDNTEYHEDFSSLSLQGSAFFPLPPALGQVDDNPQNSFTRELWQLVWRPADPIDLYVCKPRGVTKPPVILFLYTSPGNTDRFKSDDWCGTTTANGFAAVGFVSAYTGHRLEMRSPIATFFTDFQESLGATVHDVQLILDYLTARGDLDMTRVGMYGQGSGGTIAILAAAADPRIKALDVLTPWADWPDFFATTRFVSNEDRVKYMSKDYLSRVAELEPLKWLPKVKAKSVRIQNVRQSGAMPDALQERLETVAPEIAVINQYGDPAALVPHAAGGALFDWLREQLQPADKSQMAIDKSPRIHFYPASTVSPLPRLGPPAKN
jgi:hypothetical protein